MKKICLALFCALIFSYAHAQVPKNPYLKGKALDSLWNVYRFNQEQRKSIVKQLLHQYQKTDDKELLAFAELLQFSSNPNKEFSSTEKFINEIETKYKAFSNIKARTYQIIGYHYFIGNINYEKAFDAYLQLEKLLEIYGPDEITDYANYCAEIASAHYRFQNYKKALELGKKGVGYASDKWDFYNTIGLCYLELSQPDSAIFYLRKAVNEAITKKKPDIYRTISLGNIGNANYIQKKFKVAKPLLRADLNGAIRIDDKGLAAGAAIPLADIYLNENNLKVASGLLDMARSYIEQSKQFDRLERFYPIRSKYYQLQGNTKLALADRDSAINAIKRNDSVFNSLLVMRAQQRTDLLKLVEEKSKLDNYRRISELRIWTLCIIFTLIALGTIIVLKYRSRLEKDKKRIEELNRTLALRQRLSADMHDDIGSNLSSISLYAHSLLMQPQSDPQKYTLEKIKQKAQKVQESVSDIIWSVNPGMDEVAEVVARMRAFGADMTEHAGIAFEFSVAKEVTALQMDMSSRRNLYLIYKEAINNAVKYSQAKQIRITLVNKDNQFIMNIVDDGVGFEQGTKSVGNGLFNMQRRADEIKGELQVLSTKENGTTINLIFQLNRHS